MGILNWILGKKEDVSTEKSRTHTIQIRDARRGRFRVVTVAPNNEVLQTSEPLDYMTGVMTHIASMSRAWKGACSCEDCKCDLGVDPSRIWDRTKGQRFVKDGLVQPR